MFLTANLLLKQQHTGKIDLPGCRSVLSLTRFFMVLPNRGGPGSQEEPKYLGGPAGPKRVLQVVDPLEGPGSGHILPLSTIL